MPPRPKRIVLIHGAWAGAWVWDEVAAALRGLGHDPIAPDLPGDGAHRIAAPDVQSTDYMACLEAAIGPEPAVLVGHSGGGQLVTAAAAAFGPRVAAGVWIAGMLLPDGRGFDAVQEQIAGPGGRIGVTPHVLRAEDGTTTVPMGAAIRHFFQDVPLCRARSAALRLTPQPAAGLRMATRAGPAFDALPKLYIHCARDASVLPSAQRLMCAGQKALTVAEIDTGHVPQLTCPGRLAAIIDGWLSDHEAGA